jgi:hypothetical protein
MSVRAALVALVMLVATWVGCAAGGGSRAGGPRPVTGTGAGSPEGAPGRAAMIEVAIASAGERPGPPPMVRLLVDVTMSNPTPSSQWLLIPRKVPADAGGIDKNEQRTAGSIVYGVFLGNGGFYGFLLAPGARLTIRNLEVAWWKPGRATSPPALDVRTGTAVTVAGADLSTWFDRNPMVSGTVEIDAATAQHTYSKGSSTGAELDVSVAGLATRTIAVAVAP